MLNGSRNAKFHNYTCLFSKSVQCTYVIMYIFTEQRWVIKNSIFRLFSVMFLLNNWENLCCRLVRRKNQDVWKNSCHCIFNSDVTVLCCKSSRFRKYKAPLDLPFRKKHKKDCLFLSFLVAIKKYINLCVGRHMNGYGSHTFKMVNKDNQAVYVKFHFKTDQVGNTNFYRGTKPCRLR